MTLRLGDEAPNFTATTTAGIIDFHQWIGSNWAILFSHPADFTPVCTTELGMAARLKSKFEERNVKLIALSVDSLESHYRWIDDIRETQHVDINFPMIADEEKVVAELYDMIHFNTGSNHTVRSVFIIGPDKKIKLILTYPASTGRNFNELLRTLDSLQLTAGYSVATPANWQYGEDCIIVPAVTNEQAVIKFPKGFTTIKSYLRVTPQPDI